MSGSSPRGRLVIHVLPWLVALPLSAQTPDTTIVPAPSDADLEFEIRLDTLLLENGPGGLGPTLNAWVVRAPDGGYVGGPLFTPGLIGRWSAEGRFVGTFGGQGEGPGEFTHVGGLWTDGDTVFVFGQGGRLQLFVEYEFVTRRPWADEGAYGVQAASEGGDYVVSGFSPRQDRYGYPAHLVTPEGHTVRSFGTRTVGFAENGFPPYGIGWVQGGDAVWTAQSDRYVIESWSLSTGNFTGALKREFDLLPDLDRGQVRSPGDKSFAAVKWLRVDDDGLIWVGIRMPDQLGPSEALRRGSVGTLDAASRSLDYLVEVIDPRTASVVARLRTRGLHIYRWADANHGLAIVEDPRTGVPRAAVLRPVLRPYSR